MTIDTINNSMNCPLLLCCVVAVKMTLQNVLRNQHDIIRDALRKRFTSFESTSNFFGNETQRSELDTIFRRTADFGESNSVIIIGRRGSGKTALLKTALKKVCSDPSHLNNVLQVHLNGLLQTDDRIAIKEIARQLQLENTVGERVFGSFAENLNFLLDALKSGNQETKVIFFVIDEFDLFCTHHNQTLLYNLFDVSQSSNTPVLVIGLTCRLDIMELLEKRVKSRFSHRIINLFSSFDFEQYLNIFEEMLTLPESLCSNVKEWNKNIKKLKCDSQVRAVLKKIFNTSKDLGYLNSFLFLITCRLTRDHPAFTKDDFALADEHMSQDSKMEMLKGVSVLEVCLLLAMRRLTEVYDGQPFNFEMIYKEYVKFATNRAFMSFDKEIALRAFDNLLLVQFVCPAEGCSAQVPKEYRLMNLMIEPAQIMKLVDTYPGLPVEVKQWSASLIA